MLLPGKNRVQVALFSRDKTPPEDRLSTWQMAVVGVGCMLTTAAIVGGVSIGFQINNSAVSTASRLGSLSDRFGGVETKLDRIQDPLNSLDRRGMGMGPGLVPYVPIPFLNPPPVHWW